MYGKPLRWLNIARQASRAASILAMTTFAASIASLALGLPGLALGLWLVAGASAATISYTAAVYVERIASLIVERIEEAETPPPRPLLDPLTAAVVTVVAPPAAPLAVRGSVEWLVQLVDWAIQVMPEAYSEIERARVTPVDNRLYAAAVTVVGLPALVDPLWRLLDQLSCLVLRLLAVRDPSLRDKPCAGDLVEVVVWAKPLYNALDAKLFSEKWSIKD